VFYKNRCGINICTETIEYCILIYSYNNIPILASQTFRAAYILQEYMSTNGLYRNYRILHFNILSIICIYPILYFDILHVTYIPMLLSNTVFRCTVYYLYICIQYCILIYGVLHIFYVTFKYCTSMYCQLVIYIYPILYFDILRITCIPM